LIKLLIYVQHNLKDVDGFGLNFHFM